MDAEDRDYLVPGEAFSQVPKWAVEAFAKREVVPYEVYRELVGPQKAQAFSAAHVYSHDLLERVQQATLQAISEGMSLWEYQGLVESILTNPWHLETVLRTNVQAAYGAGHWRRLSSMKDLYPYVRYVTMADERVRPSHAALHGAIFRLDDPYVRANWTPRGYNCRCQWVPMSEYEVEKSGERVRSGSEPDLPGPDPGWTSPALAEWAPDLADLGSKASVVATRTTVTFEEAAEAWAHGGKAALMKAYVAGQPVEDPVITWMASLLQDTASVSSTGRRRLYRGEVLPARVLQRRYRNGAYLTLDTLTSAVDSPEVARLYTTGRRGKRVILHLESPPGVTGADLGTGEFVLPKGAEFRVVRSWVDDEGITHVHLLERVRRLGVGQPLPIGVMGDERLESLWRQIEASGSPSLVMDFAEAYLQTYHPTLYESFRKLVAGELDQEGLERFCKDLASELFPPLARMGVRAEVRVGMLPREDWDRAELLTRRGIEATLRLFDDPRILDRLERVIWSASEPRSFASSSGVVLSRDADLSTVMHELAHVAEFQSSLLYGLARNLRSHLAAFDEPRSLNEIMPQILWDYTEMAYPGLYSHPYMGKVYDHLSTEIVSMLAGYLAGVFSGQPEHLDTLRRWMQGYPAEFLWFVGVLKGRFASLR